jgi:uncharacterized RDD family membrane protein YckC
MATVTIHTSQNVRIDYEAATLGIRIGAFLIDAAAIVVSYGLFVFLLALLEAADADERVLFIFGPLFYTLLYFFASELVTRGRTVGKALLKLRVMRLDGRDPTPADFLGRAIFLIPDVLFSFGMLAVLLILAGPRRQRLGDLVSGTVVIRAGDYGGVSLADVLTIRRREEHEPSYPGVQRLTDEDMLVVKQTILRYRRYRNPGHREALDLLARRMGELIELDELPQDREAFLQELLLDYIVLTR